jgi:hypothetical protein
MIMSDSEFQDFLWQKDRSERLHIMPYLQELCCVLERECSKLKLHMEREDPEEYVEVTWKNGSVPRLNSHMDSPLAMCCDVLKHI